MGRTNITTGGRSCQVWAASQPHQHSYNHVGEHNHCRNPSGYSKGLWCYTTDPDKRWELCSVPICVSKSKVLDFSADNDHEPDSNGEYTGATLNAGFLPESFTICSAIMVDAWNVEFPSAQMFRLLDNNGYRWGMIYLFAASANTEYVVHMWREGRPSRAKKTDGELNGFGPRVMNEFTHSETIRR